MSARRHQPRNVSARQGITHPCAARSSVRTPYPVSARLRTTPSFAFDAARFSGTIGTVNGDLHAKHAAGLTLFRVPFAGLLVALACAVSPAQSAYPVRPDDAHAVYLTRHDFGVQADGETDDSDALQHAVDRVQE